MEQSSDNQLNQSEILKGILPSAVLAVVARGETYGWQVTGDLIDAGFSNLAEGTVYAILLRHERAGLVESERRKSPSGPPRKFYQITVSGQAALQNFWRTWDELNTKLKELK
jgi:DNA-binding PadR family transcriptional regulator